VENLFANNIKKYLFSYLNQDCLDLDLVLLGTGKILEKIPEDLQSLFISKNIKYEAMVSSAAYNTYNILLSEERKFISVIKLI